MNLNRSSAAWWPHCFSIQLNICREGFHNTGFANNLDACLTERGWDQAEALGRHMYRQACALQRVISVCWFLLSMPG